MLGMTITFNSGTGMSENVIYEGATSNGLKHIIRHVDGTRSHVDQCHLSLLNQIGFENIPKTPLDYCQEVGIGISQEQAQRLAYPRTLLGGEPIKILKKYQKIKFEAGIS